jgi:CHASE2 domain-containing sensor protein
MILIGSTAAGLARAIQTSKGAVYGVDLQRQILENILFGRLLWRPSFALAIEVLMTVLSAGALAFLLLNRGLVSFLFLAFGMEGLILAIGEFAIGDMPL